MRGARAYDPVSQLYNTDFYFRDCVTHQTGYKPARPARRNHTYGQMLSSSSAKWLQPAQGGDSKGMTEAWAVARGQQENAYLHIWAVEAWPGCPPFARDAVGGCAFTLLLLGRRSRRYDCSSLLANRRCSSGIRGMRSLGTWLLSQERPSAPSSNRRNSAHQGWGKKISRGHQTLRIYFQEPLTLTSLN